MLEDVRPRFYRPELDMLRFIAFILVFFHHVFPREPRAYLRYVSDSMASVLSSISNAFGFGLPLFFFLSAFLITSLLLREKDRYHHVDLAKFYMRRTLRIWPLYYTALFLAAVHAAVSARMVPGGHHDGLMLSCYVLMIGNWFFCLGGIIWSDNPFTQLWSISVEEHYYAVWPLVVRSTGPRGLVVVSGVLLALALVVDYRHGAASADRDVVVWTNTFVQFEFFALGSIVAIAFRAAPWAPTSAFRVLLVFAAIASAFVANDAFGAKAISSRHDGLGLVFGYVCIGFAVVAMFCAIHGMKRVPESLRYLGSVSYGLYVFHGLALWIVARGLDHFGMTDATISMVSRLVFGLPLTVLFATISYYLLEKRFIAMKERYAPIASGSRVTTASSAAGRSLVAAPVGAGQGS